MARFDYIHPYPLIKHNQGAPQQRRGLHDNTITGDSVYKAGDLIELDGSGNVTKLISPGAATKMAKSGQNFLATGDRKLPPNDGISATHWIFDRGVPYDIIFEDNIWVFTYRASNNGAVGAGLDANFVAADLTSVRTHVRRDLAFDATATIGKCLVIADTTANPQVEMLYVIQGEVGDDNVRVACRILEGFLLK